MAWTIDYADTAKAQLRKLDKQTARRIVDFMDERIAGLDSPRSTGKALTGVRYTERLSDVGVEQDHGLISARICSSGCRRVDTKPASPASSVFHGVILK